jgi:threonine aldolase
VIDLRSDTITRPTDRMLAAMTSAPLGDDGYGEDPTVNRLEQMAAQRLGKQDACLMPSGTMANLSALLVHAPRGGKVLLGAESDIYLYEASGGTVLGGLSYEPLPNQSDGTIALDDLAAGLPPDPTDPQYAIPALICLENTQNRCGGAVLPLDYLAAAAEFAAAHGLPVHLDGARIFNAAVASGQPVAHLAQYADSVQFCLSKGLCAPIGSIITGGGEFIGRVRRVRKLLGGAMRQAGVVAAAGIVALDEMVDRLAQDHALAHRFAAGLAELDGVTVLPVQTNVVLFRVHDEQFTVDAVVTAARAGGVLVGGFGHGRVRAVTHAGITETDVDQAVTVLARVIREGPPRSDPTRLPPVGLAVLKAPAR